MDSTTRWTVTVSRETDAALRSLLAQRGLKKSDLSKFIEDAVKWRVFDQTVTEARQAFIDVAPDALEALVEDAIEASKNKEAKKLSARKRRGAHQPRKS